MSDLTATVTKDSTGSIHVDGYEQLKYNFHYTSPVFDIKHAKLAEIYESFELDPIWDKLSKVLTRLEGDPSAAQILLPSIEVSKWTCERDSRRFSY